MRRLVFGIAASLAARVRTDCLRVSERVVVSQVAGAVKISPVRQEGS
jgi:hypothetical protein